MSDTVTVALIAAIPALLATLLGVFNHTKLGKVEQAVDGRLTELLELTRKSSEAIGIKKQKDANDASAIDRIDENTTITKSIDQKVDDISTKISKVK